MAHHSASSSLQRLSGSALQRFSVAAIVLAVVALALPLALLPLPLAVALLAVIIGVLLAVIDPTWAVCWAILSVPVQEVVQLPGGLTVTQATLLLAAGSWLLRSLAAPQQLVRWGPLGLPLAGVLAALTLSTVFTPYLPLEGAKETLRWFWVALIYLIVANCATTQQQRAMLVVCMLLAPTVEAVYGLWQFITATGPLSFQIAGGRFVRAYGTIGQPNSFAGYMNMAWPLAAAFGSSIFMSTVGSRQSAVDSRQLADQDCRLPTANSLAGIGITAILLAALGASFSRGGWVGAIGGGVALGAAMLLGRERSDSRQLRGRILIGLCAGLVLVLLLGLLNNAGVLPAPVASRLDSIINNVRLFDVRTVDVTPENFAVVERMAHIQAGWSMFTSYPLLGVGPGNFTPAYPDFAIPPWLISQGHAHNYYLHSAAEGGIVGALAYLLLVIAVARLGINTLRHACRSLDRLIALGGCGMIGAVAVHNLFENLHVLNLPIQLGAIWGLLVAIQPDALVSQRSAEAKFDQPDEHFAFGETQVTMKKA